MSSLSISPSFGVERSFSCPEDLCAESPRTAHGSIATLVESPGASDLAGDADAHASGDWSRGPWRRSQPQFTRGAEVDAVALPIDGQRHREPAWAPGKIAEAAGAAPKRHQVDPVKRFERAQENAGPDARGLARDIAHIRGSIDEIDIGMTALEIERAIAPCGPTKGVAAGIARRIGLGFNDSSAGPTV